MNYESNSIKNNNQFVGRIDSRRSEQLPDGGDFVHCIEKGVRYNANQPTALPNQLSMVLGSHFESCIENNLPLISFHSLLGHNKCVELTQKNPEICRKPKFPTALQQLMEYGFDKELIIKTSSGESYNLILRRSNVFIDQINDVPFFKASVDLTDSRGAKSTIEILEMAPRFNGFSIGEEDLKICYGLVKDFNKNKFPDRLEEQTFGQFASAKGIGRSASLLVLSKFDEMLKTKSSTSWPNSPAAMELKIAEIVKEVQAITKNRNFGHLCLSNQDMKRSVTNICLDMIETNHSTNFKSTSLEGRSTRKKFQTGQPSDLNLPKSKTQQIVTPPPITQADLEHQKANNISNTLGSTSQSSVSTNVPYRNLNNQSRVASETQSSKKKNQVFENISNPIEGIKVLSSKLIRENTTPQKYSLKFINIGGDAFKWNLNESGGGTAGFFKKNTTDYAITCHRKFKIANDGSKYGIPGGLVGLCKSGKGNFERKGLTHIKHSAPPVGRTLRLAVSSCGSVVLAIPNLEKGSYLQKAGVTAEDMENFSTVNAACATDAEKNEAISLYWNEISYVAKVFPKFEFEVKDSRGNIVGYKKVFSEREPFFNLRHQNHYPQHLRFSFQKRINFHEQNENMFFKKNGVQKDTLQCFAIKQNDMIKAHNSYSAFGPV